MNTPGQMKRFTQTPQFAGQKFQKHATETKHVLDSEAPSEPNKKIRNSEMVHDHGKGKHNCMFDNLLAPVNTVIREESGPSIESSTGKTPDDKVRFSNL